MGKGRWTCFQRLFGQTRCRVLVEYSNRRVSVLRWEPPQSVLEKSVIVSGGKATNSSLNIVNVVTQTYDVYSSFESIDTARRLA
jgi:hypothetical protein